jgi:hypothetical protein
MNFKFPRDCIRKILKLQISLKSSIWNQFFHADGQTDTTKLIATFGTFLNAPKKGCTFIYNTLNRLYVSHVINFPPLGANIGCDKMCSICVCVCVCTCDYLYLTSAGISYILPTNLSNQ